MNEIEIRDTILQILKHTAPDSDPSTLQPDDDIRTMLGLDSFDALQVIVALDEKLGVDIPEQDYGKTATLKNMVEYLREKLVAPIIAFLLFSEIWSLAQNGCFS